MIDSAVTVTSESFKLAARARAGGPAPGRSGSRSSMKSAEVNGRAELKAYSIFAVSPTGGPGVVAQSSLKQSMAKPNPNNMLVSVRASNYKATIQSN